MCFCPFTLFKQIKLGFDREYFVGGIADEHAKVYEIALEARLRLWRRFDPAYRPKMSILPPWKYTNAPVSASAIAPEEAWDIPTWNILNLKTVTKLSFRPA